MRERAASGAGAAMAVPAAGNLRPEQICPGGRYHRADGGCVADVLAVTGDQVLIVARWRWNRAAGEFTAQNCLHLNRADMAARYRLEPVGRAAR